MDATVDLACLGVADHRLVILERVAERGRPAEMPWRALDASAPFAGAAAGLARDTLGRAPGWLAQFGAFGEGLAHPSGAGISVGFVAVVPMGTAAPEGFAWRAAGERMPFASRQRRMAVAAVECLRQRMDDVPVAFRLVPPAFTLTQLQDVYEVLLERPLHKASFRRALRGARLVTATSAQTSEGRGRPARFYRFAPSIERPGVRPVRFEMLG